LFSQAHCNGEHLSFGTRKTLRTATKSKYLNIRQQRLSNVLP